VKSGKLLNLAAVQGEIHYTKNKKKKNYEKNHEINNFFSISFKLINKIKKEVNFYLT
jgi:hypothetical protein